MIKIKEREILCPDLREAYNDAYRQAIDNMGQATGYRYDESMEISWE